MKSVNEFFKREAWVLPAQERTQIFKRLKVARNAIGSADALQWFTEWKTPEEVLRGIYVFD